jgi:hypothetical protein
MPEVAPVIRTARPSGSIRASWATSLGAESIDAKLRVSTAVRTTDREELGELEGSRYKGASVLEERIGPDQAKPGCQEVERPSLLGICWDAGCKPVPRNSRNTSSGSLVHGHP